MKSFGSQMNAEGLLNIERSELRSLPFCFKKKQS